MSSRRDTPIGAAIYIIATAGVAYLFVILARLPGASRRGDFSIYYACAVATHRGLDPYAIDLNSFTRELGFERDPFKHPADTPTFTLVTTPLAMMSAPVAYGVWFVASALCLMASLYLLFGALDRRMAILFSLASLGFTPIADNFRWAQSQLFVTFGVLMFFLMLRRGRDCTAAVILAAMGLLRGFPLVLGGYLIVRREWRAIVVLAIAFVAGAAATVAAMGATPVENFLRIIGIIGAHQWFSLEPRWGIAAANVSLDAFVARPLIVFFGHNSFEASRTIVLVAKLLILAITFRVTKDSPDDRDGRGFSLWIATMLLLTPVVWLHYLTLLIVPGGLIAVLETRRRTSARVWRLAIFSYCAITLVTPLMSTLTFRNDIFDWRVASAAELGFLTMLLAWFASLQFASEKTPQ